MSGSCGSPARSAPRGRAPPSLKAAAGGEPVSTWLRRLGLEEAKRRSAARSVATLLDEARSEGFGLSEAAAVLRAAGVTFRLVWTPGIVAGCLRVLAYPRVARILAPTGRQEYARRVVAGLAAGADMVSPELLPKLRAVKADPDDDLFLATALAGGAQVLVSGDRRHLLSMKEYAGVRIVGAATFLEELARRRSR